MLQTAYILWIIVAGLRVTVSQVEVVSSLGDSAKLRCDARFYDGVPHFLEWFKGRVAIYSKFDIHDAYLHPAFQGRVTIENRSHLVFGHLQTGDGGNYTCRMHLIDGAAFVYEESTLLKVLEAPSLLYTPPNYMTGEKGSLMTLSCRASGTPTPTLTWSKDGVRLQPTQRISIVGDVLKISNFGSSDVGRYKCMFTNPHGHAAYTTSLILEGGALITAPPKNLTVNSGEAVNFQCEASASPSNITYWWFKDGVNINNIRRLSTKASIGEDGSLSITTVGESNSGVYRCTVSNGLGAPMSAEAHLSVIFTPQVDQTQIRRDIYIPLGSAGTLPCPVKGYPPVTHVVWSKTSNVITTNSPRYKITPEFSLIIHNVTINDAGWYTCTPHNEYGPGVQSDIMKVVALDPPKFTVRPNPIYTLKIHDTITLPCAAETSRSVQLTFTWQKTDGLLPAKSRVMLHRLGNMTISDVQKEDSGLYKCVASDREIESVVRTELSIENTTPHAPINVTALFSHFDIRISWEPGFDGGFTQTYVVQFRETERGDGNWQILPDRVQDAEYTIYGLIPETEYEVRVQSSNEIGDGPYSKSVVGSTLGYTPGALGSLPSNAAGQVMFPSIIKPLGPAPSPPENFTVRHDEGEGVEISWDKPLETPVPILYYRIEYKRDGDSDWSLGSPVLANKLNTSFVPEEMTPDVIVKYYFRVRAYGLLSYSDYSDAVIIYFPKQPAANGLGIGAKAGIGVAALFFVGLLIAVIIILCDIKPSKDKRGESKNGSQAHYSIAPQTPNGTSEWQSFYPYHGGRFAINGEADNIYVIDSQRENALTNSSTERDGSVVRHEQGWYFPRDGHPEQDLTRTYDSSSSDKGPPPNGISYTANYSNYNGLLHGYYDARTGTQISPNVINYPHSGLEASDMTDGATSSRRHLRVPPAPTIRRTPLNTLRNESHPIYANQYIVSQNVDPNWFAPHSQPQTLHEHTSTVSPISLSYDHEQEIVLKPSLPRHSSLRPSIRVPPDDDEVPFDPSLSTVRESSAHNVPSEQTNYDFYTTNQFPYTNGWVESQKPVFGNSHSPQGRANTFRQKSYEYPSRLREYHTLASNSNIRGPAYPPHTMVARHMMERGSSVGSSVNEMRTHYNRDRLLGTVERVRSTSSRSRRPGSAASVSSGQLSPQINGYVHSPLPPPYELTECYPELVSPVYYNNNNNRQDTIPSKLINYQPPKNQSYMETSPHYENSGLLTSTKYQAPAFAHDNSAGPSRLSTSANATSGIGSTWSPSKMESGQRKSRPSWSRSSAPTPYEYDMSCESSPAAVLPQFSSNSDRYLGLYAKPKYVNGEPSKQNPPWKQHSKTSYDPSFLLGGYNSQQNKPHQSTHRSSTSKLTPRAPSDSVDENYEFDPILIDSEPQDFFHIHSVDMPEQIESELESSQRPSLYAEQPTPPAFRSSQRFSRLRDEYNTFKERQNSAKRRMALSRLESEIL